jgi:predicted phosphohydrolase
MKIQIVSDLHIDHDSVIESPFESITPSAEILLIVGDTCSIYNYELLSNYLKIISPFYKKILFIPGNHEYYTVRNKVKFTWKCLRKCLYFLQTEIKNLVIFDKEYIEIDNYIVAGCTLWSEYDRETLPKYFRIHKLTSETYIKFHRRDVKFIRNMMTFAKEQKKKLILATHYPPTKRYNNFETFDTEYKSLYGTELDNLINWRNVHTWIFGHNHGIMDGNIDTTIRGTRILTNQKGKGKLSMTNYSSKRIIF